MSRKIRFIRQIQTDGWIRQIRSRLADTHQYAYPPIFLSLSLIHIQMRAHTRSPPSTHKHPKINSSLQCVQICMHKHTDTDERVRGKATFISLQSKNRRQCVHSLTCDTKLILSENIGEGPEDKTVSKKLIMLN